MTKKRLLAKIRRNWKRKTVVAFCILFMGFAMEKAFSRSVHLQTELFGADVSPMKSRD